MTDLFDVDPISGRVVYDVPEKPAKAYDLYGGTPPHESPATSAQAAHAIRPHVGKLQQVVLDEILASGSCGMTDDDVERATDLRHQTASARRRELYLKGCIRYRLDANGNKVKRKTSSGRYAFVFVGAA